MASLRADEGTASASEDEAEEEWEIPYAPEDEVPPSADENLEVRVEMRPEVHGLGVVLDSQHVVVAFREGSTARGKLCVGDCILAIEGVSCKSTQSVAELLRQLPALPAYTLTVRRALRAAPIEQQGTGDITQGGDRNAVHGPTGHTSDGDGGFVDADVCV